VTINKYAKLCVPDATIAVLPTIKLVSPDGAAMMTSITDVIKNLTGGLWVTGRVILSDKTLGFTESAEGKFFTGNDVSFAVPVQDIDKVDVGFGLLGNRILHVWVGKAEFKINVFTKAQAFAASIRSAAGIT
jgi:hypothetical protein